MRHTKNRGAESTTMTQPCEQVSPGGLAASQPVATIFFDGDCGHCNRFVRLVLAMDRDGVFRFAPLQSQVAASLLGPDPLRHNSIAVQIASTGEIKWKSAAVLYVLSQCRGLPRLVARVFALIPDWILNLGYDWFARYRKTIFGSSYKCDLSAARYKDRFLR
jgi:predicted DCC family thiol-disulfide oxidoreductase YuxK